MTDVKICGITRREDAVVADDAGARYIGAVMYAASPRNVDPERARELSGGLTADLVVVVADESVATVVERARRAEAAVVQLHGRETVQDARDIASEGHWEVWKGVRARTSAEVRATIREFTGAVSAVLVDGWHPTRIGGTGVRVRWDELPGVRDELPEGMRLVAAGGLSPDNVAEIVTQVRPHVVDVSSGVELRPGRKDPARVRAFVEAVARAGGDPGRVAGRRLGR
jgi:phosphoribosylanthranilate isomerase